MSHWGGDSDNTLTDSDYETDSEIINCIPDSEDEEYIDTDTERIGDSDSEVIEFDIDATSGDETETEEDLSQGREAPPSIQRTCSIVQGLCTTGVQPRGVEVQGLCNSSGRGHDIHGDHTVSERSATGQQCQRKGGAKSDLQES